VTPRTSPIQHEPASAEPEQPFAGQAAAEPDITRPPGGNRWSATIRALTGVMPPDLSVMTDAAVPAGAVAQRLTGIGFSLIVAPALTLAIGPSAGVDLTNLLTLLMTFAVLATSARRADLARSLHLVPAAGLMGVLPGSILAGLLPARPLQAAAGTVAGPGLLAVVTAPHLQVRPSRAVTICAGAGSGLTTALAGAGGPALTVYAVAAHWPQQESIATGQLNYAIQAAVALAIKGHPGSPAASPPGAATSILAGLAAGAYLASRTSGNRSRQATIVLARLAALATVIAGAAP
jgi:uncharacterized protein